MVLVSPGPTHYTNNGTSTDRCATGNVWQLCHYWQSCCAYLATMGQCSSTHRPKMSVIDDIKRENTWTSLSMRRTPEDGWQHQKEDFHALGKDCPIKRNWQTWALLNLSPTKGGKDQSKYKRDKALPKPT